MAAAAVVAAKWKKRRSVASQDSLKRFEDLDDNDDDQSETSNIADDLVRNPFKAAATFVQNGVHLEDDYSSLPIFVDRRTEAKAAGDLFLENFVFKTCRAVGSDRNPNPWMPMMALLGRDRIYFTSGLNTDDDSSAVLEDSPLFLIQWIKAGVLIRDDYSPTLWQVYVDLRRRSLTTVLDGSIILGDFEQQASNQASYPFPQWFQSAFHLIRRALVGQTDRNGISVQPPPDETAYASICSADFSADRFLRIHVRCTDLPSADLTSQSDPMVILTEATANGWVYLGQTECIQDQRDPVFATQLDLALPTAAARRRLRFTVVDVDDKDCPPTTFDPDAPPAGADLLGLAELDAADLLALIRADSPELSLALRAREGWLATADRAAPAVHLRVEEVQESRAACLLFRTRAAGRRAPRDHALLFRSERARNAWSRAVRRAMARCLRARAQRNGPLLAYQDAVRCLYALPRVQLVSGGLVLCLFVADIADAEWGSSGGDSEQVFWTVDACFTAVFALELLVNLYGSWLWPFLLDPWNLFDAVSVLASMLSLLSDVNLATIRLVRVFRVMRLIRRVPSLRVIINSLAACIPALVGALLVFLLVTAVAAIMAVDYWADQDPTIKDFASALFTMFAIGSGDSWVDLARKLFNDGPAAPNASSPTANTTADVAAASGGNGTAGVGGAAGEGGARPAGAVYLFFACFIIVSAWLLLNIVIAILLDEFSEAEAGEKLAMEPAAANFQGEDSLYGQLAPLLERLTDSESLEELERRVDRLWVRMQAAAGVPLSGAGGRRTSTSGAEAGRARFSDFCRELRRYGVALAPGEWCEMLRQAALDPAVGLRDLAPHDPAALAAYALDRRQFRQLLKHYVGMHVQLGLGFAGRSCGEGDVAGRFKLSALKLILLAQTQAAWDGAHDAPPLPPPEPLMADGGPLAGDAAGAHPQAADERDPQKPILAPHGSCGEAAAAAAAAAAARVRCLVLEAQAGMCWGGVPPPPHQQRVLLRHAAARVRRLRARLEGGADAEEGWDDEGSGAEAASSPAPPPSSRGSAGAAFGARPADEGLAKRGGAGDWARLPGAVLSGHGEGVG